MGTLTAVYRPAQVEDCAAIAQLFQLAANGIADLVWQTLQTLQPQYAGKQNQGALQYQQQGFSILGPAAVVPHPLIHYTDDVLLITLDF